MTPINYWLHQMKIEIYGFSASEQLFSMAVCTIRSRKGGKRLLEYKALTFLNSTDLTAQCRAPFCFAMNPSSMTTSYYYCSVNKCTLLTTKTPLLNKFILKLLCVNYLYANCQIVYTVKKIQGKRENTGSRSSHERHQIELL